MRHIAAGMAALAGVLLVGAAGSHYAYAKKPPRQAAAPSPTPGAKCMRFDQAADADKKELVFSLKNQCKERLECKLTWDVTCSGTAEPQSQTTLIEMGAREDFRASAAGCTGDWRISPARWTCRTPSAGDTASR